MLMVCWCAHGDAQALAAAQTSQPADSPIDDTLAAGDSDADVPVRKLVNRNEYEGKWFSIRGGGGFLLDYAAFAQVMRASSRLGLIRSSSCAMRVRCFEAGSNSSRAGL